MAKLIITPMAGTMPTICEEIGRLTGSPYWDTATRRHFNARLTEACVIRLDYGRAAYPDLVCVVARGSKQFQNDPREYEISIHTHQGFRGTYRLQGGMPRENVAKQYHKAIEWFSGYRGCMKDLSEVLDAFFCVFPPR